MRVVDLLNALQRFPGDAEVEADSVEVNGVPVVHDGAVTLAVEKGTKGVKAEAEAEAPRRRRKSEE